MSVPDDEEFEDHEHDKIRFDRTHVENHVLKELDEVFPALSECLSLTAKYPDLSEGDREDVKRLSVIVEREGPITAGFHADGDHCAVCEQPTQALFTDAFHGDASLEWAAFALDLPVHLACVSKLEETFPRPAPRVLDQARRRLVADFQRPPAQVAAFFRHDVLAHGELDLEDWEERVFEENAEHMDRRLAKGMDKCVRYVHKKLYHAHDDGHAH